MTRDELEQVIYERTREFVKERVLDCILELISAEREKCAEICDNSAKWSELAYALAAAIRARGESK